MDLERRCRAIEAHLGGRLGVVYEPLGGGSAFAWRGRERFPAASVIKVPMMVAVLQAVQAGTMSLDEVLPLRPRDVVGGAGVLMELHPGIPLTILDLVHLMIVVSDNTASNMLMDRLGRRAHNEAFYRMGLSGTILGRKFMIDPEASFQKNFTTPHDMALCLRSLYQGRYLDRARTDLAVDVMARQQYREKIPLLLPETTRIAHKTGEIHGVRHDVALILTDRPYLLVCLTHEVQDVLAADRAIAELSRDVYAQAMSISSSSS